MDWYEFLNFLGDKVRLKGWQHFSGGLDVKHDTTGLCTPDFFPHNRLNDTNSVQNMIVM